MQELEKHTRDSEKQSIEAVVEKEQKKELKYVGSITPHKGHKLWAINVKTMEVEEAKYTGEELLDLSGHFDDYASRRGGPVSSVKRKVKFEKDMIYISALNKRNALDRYKKGKGAAWIAKGNEKLV